MATDDPALNWTPSTPARRTARVQSLSSLFRTPTRLNTPTTASHRNKRGRERSSPLPPSTPMSPSINSPSLPAVVLQTYSVSTDSIVVTALPSVPFCCHEDLLTMSRTQLEGVVRALNQRLPRRMRIGPEGYFWHGDQSDHNENEEEDDGLSRMSEAEMKKRIEELVGIRAIVGKNRVSRSGLGLGTSARAHRVPPAPKAVRTRDPDWRPYDKDPWDMEAESDRGQMDDLGIPIEDDFMGSSPLANRTKVTLRARGRISTLSRLASLQEESEGSESTNDEEDDDETRPLKRQRVLSGSSVQSSEQESQARESRLVEDMDVSGSPLMDGDTEASFDNVTESDVRDTLMGSDCDAMKEKTEGVQTTLQRRPESARIRGVTLRRIAPADAMKTTLGAQLGLRSSISRSKTFSSRRSSRNNSSVGKPDGGIDSDPPRELVIRLPFTSTPPQQKPDSSDSWTTARVLRSRSQRFLNPIKPTKSNMSLGRSQSEKYPRASDMAFVTIDRPRYRFRQHKSKESSLRLPQGDQDPNLQKSTTPAEITCQPRQGTCNEDMSEEHDYSHTRDAPRVVTGNGGMGGLCTLPFTLYSFLTPRSRAPSTSTVASTNGGNSSVQTVDGVRETEVPTVITNLAARDAVRVSDALERMVVDSLEDCSSKE